MKYLNLKLKRDLKNNWQQFFSVFLMSLLSVLIFVGLQGAWHGLEKSLNNYISDSNLPNIWVQAANLTAKDIKAIKSLQGIDKVISKTRTTAKVGNNNSEEYLFLDTFDSTFQNSIHTVKGEKISENSSGGIWLNKEYGKEKKLAVGDTIKLTILGQTTKTKINGFVQSADRIYFTGSMEYIAPNYAKYAYGYISPKTLKKLSKGILSQNRLEIYTSKKDLRDEIEKILGNKLVSYDNRKTLVDVSEATDRVGQIRNLSYMFSFIFILLAILSMFTTIRRLIESQTQDIAVIKALGYSNEQVSRHYISFGFLVSLVGAIVGLVVSPFMSWFVLTTQQNMFSIPKWQIAYSWSSLVLVLIVIAICSISAYLASRKIIVGLPAEFLRGKDKDVKHILLEKINILWSKISYEGKWAIRDAAINRIRVLMGIIGVAGGMMLLIAGIGMPISMNHLVNKAYNEDFSYYKRLNVTDYNKIQNNYQGQLVQINQAHFSKDDGSNRLLIIVNKGDFVNAKTESGEKIKDGGLYVTRGFAKLSKIRVGDKISVTPYQDGKKYSFEVKGIVTSETNQGAYLISDTFEKAGGKFNPQTILIGKKEVTSGISKDENIISTIDKSDQENNAYDFVNSLMSVFMMIIGFAILLVVVVLYNLGSLNFVERMRDYATLQVLGYSKKNLQKITMLENLMTTMVGWIVGIPMGILFLNQYVATFSTMRIEYTAFVDWRVLIGASTLVWFTSIFTTFIISRRIKNIDMVEALKGVE